MYKGISVTHFVFACKVSLYVIMILVNMGLFIGESMITVSFFLSVFSAASSQRKSPKGFGDVPVRNHTRVLFCRVLHTKCSRSAKQKSKVYEKILNVFVTEKKQKKKQKKPTKNKKQNKKNFLLFNYIISQDTFFIA